MEDKRLDRLMTYTVFHIGLYMSLTTAILAGTIFGRLDQWVFRWTVAFLVVAGACGGIIAANIAEYRGEVGSFFGTNAAETNYQLEIWGRGFLGYPKLARIEHAAFWIGLLPLVAYFVFCGRQVFPTSTH